MGRGRFARSARLNWTLIQAAVRVSEYAEVDTAAIMAKLRHLGRECIIWSIHLSGVYTRDGMRRLLGRRMILRQARLQDRSGRLMASSSCEGPLQRVPFLMEWRRGQDLNLRHNLHREMD
jgi:hypothetical protein